MASRIQIKNMALAELPDAPITSENEQSLQARETDRFYAQCRDELLEAHDWSFATARAALAQVPNTRPGEWLYAYDLPSDFATARRVLPAVPANTTDLIFPPLDAFPSVPYLIDGGILFTDQETAILEYGREAISESLFTALFTRALVLDVAVRIAMPLGKSRELKGDLIQQAELARQRAIVDDMNRQPNRASLYENEAMVAREGYSYAYIPPRSL